MKRENWRDYVTPPRETLDLEELDHFESSLLMNRGVCANDRRRRHRHHRYRQVRPPRVSRDEVKESLTVYREEDAVIEDETALKEAMLRK